MRFWLASNINNWQTDWSLELENSQLEYLVNLRKIDNFVSEFLHQSFFATFYIQLTLLKEQVHFKAGTYFFPSQWVCVCKFSWIHLFLFLLFGFIIIYLLIQCFLTWFFSCLKSLNLRRSEKQKTCLHWISYLRD